MAAFTNIHSHVFTAKHSPDYFLKTALPSYWPGWFSDAVAKRLNDFLQRKNTKYILSLTDKILKIFSPDFRSVLRRYIEFVNIGTSSTQKEIFDDIANAYAHLGDFQIIVLTQVLDYLDIEQEPNNTRIQTQVHQIVELKRHALYQKNIYPFLGVDPRMKGVDLKEWVQTYISKDYGFCGIKIYPAAGYFPFDPSLDKVWAWAEENEIPVMTHCTRGGSWYLGSFKSLFNFGNFKVQTLNPNSPAMPQIDSRIMSLKKDLKTQKKNSLWCNIFGHPQNYRPVLEKYPNLKLCLAHLGSANEIQRFHNELKSGLNYPNYFNDNWYDEVIHLMKDYGNVYSDISYTLSNTKALKLIKGDFGSLKEPKIFSEYKDKNGETMPTIEQIPLLSKIMYGTDFYLTQQEKLGDEPDLQNNFFSIFGEDVKSIAYDAPERFLKNKILY